MRFIVDDNVPMIESCWLWRFLDRV